MNESLGANDGYGTSQLPLAGTVLCCTSIPPEQRTALAAMATQMGAAIKLDLTSDVTHLIAGNAQSAKYRYVAKCREDVKVLAPTWLEALRKVWIKGSDHVNFRSLEEQYRLPTFFGLKICLTGFDNPDQRKYMQETVTQHGAEYHGDLTKNVTHLIAATPSGKKYEHAVSWRMKIVTWEWFEQSCQRGMALDEGCFLPTMAVEDRGRGAWDRRRRSPSPLLGKRLREAGRPPQALHPLKRQLRRSASSRMGSQSEALWAGITAVGLERRANEDDDWTEASHEERLPMAPTPQSAHIDPSVTPHDAAPCQDPASHATNFSPASRANDGIFQGRVVFPYGFDAEKTKILQDHLSNNGAAMLDRPEDILNLPSDDLKHAFLIIPHDAVVDLTELPGGAGNMSLVTNWWVERCLHSKTLADPAESVLCTPFTKLRISGFPDLIVNATGFAGIELLQVTKVITLMGATYDEYLTNKTTVMVCNSRNPSPAKLKFAHDNQITAVHATWLWECIRSGELQPYDRFVVDKVGQHPLPKPQKAEKGCKEFPSIPLSEADNSKSRERKGLGGKKSPKSNAHAGSHQPRVLNLTSSKGPSPLSTSDSMTNLNTADLHSRDGGDVSLAHFDGPSSIPLRERDINPSMNSPRRQSTSSNGSNAKSSSSKSMPEIIRKPAPVQRQTRDSTPDSVIPPNLDADPAAITREPEEDYTSIMSEFLARRKQSKTNPANDKPKPRRQLGRAASSRSAASTADDHHSRAGSVVIEDGEKQAIETEPSRRPVMGIADYQPSQELGWEAPGAQEARERMIRAIGGTVQDEGVKVGSIGMVKDVVGGMEMSPGGAREQRAGRRRRM